MDREGFVDVIRLVVQDGAVDSTIAVLSRPPGRKPDPALVALSGWFNSLSLQDRQNVERVIREAASYATFGFLCVLDGEKAIENPPDKGTLDLRYRRGVIDVSLTDESDAPLHEFY